MGMMKHSLPVLFAVVVLGVSVSLAQNEDAVMKLRLAQSFEQNGDWERATAQYEALFLGNPQNIVYFEGLRQGYTQLKQYDKAIDLIQYWISKQQRNPSLLSELGGVYHLKGDESKADSLWRLVIKTDTKNPSLYRIVASKFMEFRLYDRAIQLFLEARTSTGNNEQFVDDLAMLYTAFQQYDEATREYISLLIARPDQLSSIQSRMSMMVTRPEALTAARRVVEAEMASRKESVPLLRLAAWLSMEAKEYDAALGQYRKIDRLANAGGTELFTFGQEATQEHAYSAAGKAFQEIIEQYPRSAKLPYARFGYARAREEVAAASDSSISSGGNALPTWPVSETLQGYNGVIQLYEAIIADDAGSEFAIQSYFRLGVVKQERLFDFDGALAAYEKIRSLQPNHPLASEASLRIGQVWTAKNDLPAARQEYGTHLGNRNPEMRNHAIVALAELDYYEASFDSAAAKLQVFMSSTSNDLANDALHFLYFIQENKSDNTDALVVFARGDLLMRQRKYSEALAQFEDCIRRFPDALVLDDATMNMAELKLLLGRTAEGLELFRAVALMPLSILRDRAQLRIGEVYEMILKNKEKAIEAYEQLLTKFPHSLHLEKVRLRIRMLRGDVL
jgi:tetratricopeptide (TPR) repeat protein